MFRHSVEDYYCAKFQVILSSSHHGVFVLSC